MFTNIEIDVHQLPKFEHVEYQPLSPNAPKNHIIPWLIAYGVLLTTLPIGYLLNIPLMLNYPWFYLGAVLIMFCLTICWVYYSHRFKGYALRESDILYKTGVVWRKQTILPFNRIQHLEVQRSLLERKLDLTSIKLYTAGGLRADLQISGLEGDTAESIRQFLLSKINNEMQLNDD
jgi:membrane protein YdbS with pleckstrin-like domain